MLYLTLDEIKKHLNIDSDFIEDDAYLESLETVAVELIQKHIDHSLNLLEVDGQLPLSLKQGILLCIGNFYNNRESVAYAQSHEVPSNLQWILDLYQYYDSTTESGGDSDIDKKITELETKIKELVTAIEAKADQSVIDTLTSDIANLSNTVSKLQSTVDTIEPKVTALDSTVASIQSEVSTIKSDVDKSISDLSNKVSTKLDTTTFNEYQTTVDTKFDNIEKEITKAGKIDDVQVNNKSVVKDRVANIDLSGYATSSTIESLQSQISTNKDNIASNDNKITAVKSDVSSLSNKVSTKLDTTTFIEYQTTVDTKFDNVEKEIQTAGKVQDVQVNGKTVVTDKVAKIDLSDYATTVELEQTEDKLTTAIAQKADKTSIPTKVSQLTNDSNYYSTDEDLVLRDKTIQIINTSGVDIDFIYDLSDGGIAVFGGTFIYPDNGNPFFNNDINFKNGSILTMEGNAQIAFFGDDDTTLNIQSTGITLGDGSPTTLFSTDGKTYDISPLQSSVSTNTSNISTNTNNISTLTTRVTTLESTVANIDTLLTTILNG